MKVLDQSLYLVWLTRGRRGEWRQDFCAADDSAAARERAEQLNPGWRCYAVQLTLADATAV